MVLSPESRLKGNQLNKSNYNTILALMSWGKCLQPEMINFFVLVCSLNVSTCGIGWCGELLCDPYITMRLAPLKIHHILAYRPQSMGIVCLFFFS